MFLEAGHLRYRLEPRIMALNFLLMLTATLLAAWGPSTRASRIRPVDAMRENA
jgi:ABC-type lipoprotein release transport system permease subunit